MFESGVHSLDSSTGKGAHPLKRKRLCVSLNVLVKLM